MVPMGLEEASQLGEVCCAKCGRQVVDEVVEERVGGEIKKSFRTLLLTDLQITHQPGFGAMEGEQVLF